MWTSNNEKFYLLVLVSLGFKNGITAKDMSDNTTVGTNCPRGGDDEDFRSVFYLSDSEMRTKLEIIMDSEMSSTFNYTLICETKCTYFTLSLTAPDPNLLIITSETTFNVTCKDAVLANRIFVPVTLPAVAPSGPPTYLLQGKLLVSLASGIIGRTGIEFVVVKHSKNNVSDVIYVQDNNANVTEAPNEDDAGINATVVSRKTFGVSVIRRMRPVDFIFRLVVYCVQVFVMTGFGAKLDLQVVKDNLFRPVAPAIGLSCQYILMPLIAFTVAKLVPIDNDAVSMGIFIAGVCPGGGASNIYSFLLQGDLSLSITMTALSTVAALVMMPLWVYTLGRLFDLGHGISIPFHMVAVSLSILIIPLVFGVFLRQKFPKIADKVQKLLKPVTVIMSLVLLVVGIYSNLYIFRLFKPRIILAALLLPYVGYFVGGVAATILRQGWKRIKTISLETGMQNTSIGYILLTSSFPAPDGDIAAVGPVASAVMTPLPPFTITVIYLIYQYCKKKYSPVPVEDSDEKTAKDVETKNVDEQKLTAV